MFYSSNLVESDVNAANVCSSDSSEGKEAELPIADVHGTLVDTEQTLQPVRHLRPHAEQLACNIQDTRY